MLKRFWNSARRAMDTPRKNAVRTEPRVEPLEARQVLSTPGVDYDLSGFAWANPSKITYSFPSDGVLWDVAANDLNAKLGAVFGGDGWKREIAKALQTWASVANINVVPVPDGNLAFNVHGKTQGDPRFGDIRIGGYPYGELQTLAQTYFPPPNGITGAGDVEINTSFRWNPGGDFDLFSVLLHETGHSLGLDHPTDPEEVLHGEYHGVRSGLMPGDIAGIQALYGPRRPDAFQLAGKGTSVATAIDLNSRLSATNQAYLGGVSLDTIGDTEYFTVTAPTIAGARLSITAASGGVSSLSPKLIIFDASMNPIADRSDPSAWGNNVSVTLANLVPGGRYYVAVSGATNDVFSVGDYGLSVEFTGLPSRPVTPTPIPTPLPTTPTPAPSVPPSIPPDRFEPNSTFNQTTSLGLINQANVTGLSLSSGNDADIFTFRAGRVGSATITSGSTTLRVVNQFGQIVGTGPGATTFRSPRVGVTYFVVVTSLDGKPLSNYSLGITIRPNATASKSRRAAQVARASTEGPAADPSGSAVERLTPLQRHQRVEVLTDRWRKPLRRR